MARGAWNPGLGTMHKDFLLAVDGCVASSSYFSPAAVWGPFAVRELAGGFSYGVPAVGRELETPDSPHLMPEIVPGKAGRARSPASFPLSGESCLQ